MHYLTKNVYNMENLQFNELPNAFCQLYKKMENVERLLLEKSNETQPEADQLLTIQQAGELLKLSVPTLYGLVQRSAIPVNKVSKRLYFSRLELLDWVKSGRKKTMLEIATEADKYLTKKR